MAQTVAKWDDAVRASAEGILLDVEVVPGASESKFPVGYNEWRRRIQARVAAPAHDGKANEELLRIVAAFFARPPAQTRLAGGATSRQKRVLLAGGEETSIRARLAEVLDGR